MAWLMLRTPCQPTGCDVRFQSVSSWSLAPGAESSCQAFPVKGLHVPSPGAQPGGMAAGEPTCQALSQREEQAEKHQSSLARQAQA